MWINKTDQKHHACWLGNRLKRSSNRGGGPIRFNPRERVGGALDQGGSGGGGRRF